MSGYSFLWSLIVERLQPILLQQQSPLMGSQFGEQGVQRPLLMLQHLQIPSEGLMASCLLKFLLLKIKDNTIKLYRIFIYLFIYLLPDSSDCQMWKPLIYWYDTVHMIKILVGQKINFKGINEHWTWNIAIANHSSFMWVNNSTNDNRRLSTRN